MLRRDTIWYEFYRSDCELELFRINAIVDEFIEKISKKISITAEKMMNYTIKNEYGYFSTKYFSYNTKRGLTRPISKMKFDEYQTYVKGIYPYRKRRARLEDKFGIEGTFCSYHLLGGLIRNPEFPSSNENQLIDTVRADLYSNLVQRATEREETYYRSGLPRVHYSEITKEIALGHFKEADLCVPDDSDEAYANLFLGSIDTHFDVLKRNREYSKIFSILTKYIIYGEKDFSLFE